MKRISEVRVPRSERIELYRDENIVVVLPLTHFALKKYAHMCQWCINDDRSEWEDYHKGRHSMIIQRKPKKLKMGITGHPTASEILIISRWDDGGYGFDDVCSILGYEFKDEIELNDYYVTITNNIDNFATNIVYYSPENGIYDMEDNYLWGFQYEITDVPNVNSEIVNIIDNYLEDKNDQLISKVNESTNNMIQYNRNFKNSYERLINKSFSKKYPWFINFKLDILTLNGFRNGYMGISGIISVDSDWLGEQWREYFYSIPFPNDLNDVSFGDFIGGDLSKSIKTNFLEIFNLLEPEGRTATTMSYSWINVNPLE